MVAKNFYAIWLLTGLISLAAMSGARAIEVTIDRDPVAVNESFQLVFTMEREPDRAPNFSVLRKHFTILSNNRSSNISIINGDYQRSIKWTLQMMAKKTGKFTIPAIRFDHERSKSFEITVLPSRTSAAPGTQLTLELLADKQQSLVQSQIIVTLRLRSATSLSAYQFGDLSIAQLDAVIESLGDERQYQTRIANQPYLVLEKQFALFPQQAGRLDLSPVYAEVRLPSGRRFDPFGTGGEVRQLRSQALSIEVLPVPADYNADYWLPADRLELREQWQGDLTQLIAGEPVTRSITLIADGLTAAQLPELELAVIDGVKQYPDQPVLQDERSRKGISGRREQKLALIPAAAGRYQVPQLSLPWWNRQTGKMETAIIPAREMIVAAGATVASAPITAPTAASESPAIVAPAPNSFWVWLSLLLACGWGLSGCYWWYKSYRSQVDSTPEVESASLRQLRKALRLACSSDDAVAARQALLAWGKALPLTPAIDNLRELGERFGAPMQAQIEQLNQSLYSVDDHVWRGDKLWQICERWQRHCGRQRDQRERLQPLNPTA